MLLNYSECLQSRFDVLNMFLGQSCNYLLSGNIEAKNRPILKKTDVNCIFIQV